MQRRATLHFFFWSARRIFLLHLRRSLERCRLVAVMMLVVVTLFAPFPAGVAIGVEVTSGPVPSVPPTQYFAKQQPKEHAENESTKCPMHR